VLTVVLELCVARRGERISQHLEVVLQLRQVERRVVASSVLRAYSEGCASRTASASAQLAK
jgi:hypothetical protein